MTQYLIEQLKTKSILVETNKKVVQVGGTEHIESITTQLAADGRMQERRAHALFVFIGARAETSWMPEGIEREARGVLRTGHDVTNWPCKRAGDVRCVSVKRAASGVGEGSIVVSYVHQYLAAATNARRPSSPPGASLGMKSHTQTLPDLYIRGYLEDDHPRSPVSETRPSLKHFQ